MLAYMTPDQRELARWAWSRVLERTQAAARELERRQILADIQDLDE